MIRKIQSAIIVIMCCYISSAKPVLISNRPCEYREVFAGPNWQKFKPIITCKELLSDLDMLCYYLETAYIGYDRMCELGFDGEKLKSTFLDRYKNRQDIDTRLVFGEVAYWFEPYINDRHFGLFTWYGEYSPTKAHIFYYTNTFVEKRHDGFFLFMSDDTMLYEGMKYGGNEENLFYYPMKGKNIYRVGIIALENPDVILALFDGQIFRLKVFDDKAIDSDRNVRYREHESLDSGYVSLSSFLLPDANSQYHKGAEIVLSKFAELSAKWHDKKNIILDLRSNQGGYAEYPEYLVYSLFTNNKKTFSLENASQEKCEKWISKYIDNHDEMESPAIAQINLQINEQLGINDSRLKKAVAKQMKSPVLTKYHYSSKETPQKNKDTFKGKLIILVDRNSKSATEHTVILAKKLFGENVFVVGENTDGCCEYRYDCDYLLPSSNAVLHCGYGISRLLQSEPQWHDEGIGIYPDYWAISEDLNDTIFLVTSDSEMREKLAGIESRLM